MKDHRVHIKQTDMQNSNKRSPICQIGINKIGSKAIQDKSTRLLKSTEETTDFNHQKRQATLNKWQNLKNKTTRIPFILI